jgi:hypothetical protein
VVHQRDVGAGPARAERQDIHVRAVKMPSPVKQLRRDPTTVLLRLLSAAMSAPTVVDNEVT